MRFSRRRSLDSSNSSSRGSGIFSKEEKVQGSSEYEASDEASSDVYNAVRRKRFESPRRRRPFGLLRKRRPREQQSYEDSIPEDSDEDEASGQSYADALARDLEEMGYDLSCDTFFTKGSAPDLNAERYVLQARDDDGGKRKKNKKKNRIFDGEMYPSGLMSDAESDDSHSYRIDEKAEKAKYDTEPTLENTATDYSAPEMKRSMSHSTNTSPKLGKAYEFDKQRSPSPVTTAFQSSRSPKKSSRSRTPRRKRGSVADVIEKAKAGATSIAHTKTKQGRASKSRSPSKRSRSRSKSRNRAAAATPREPESSDRADRADTDVDDDKKPIATPKKGRKARRSNNKSNNNKLPPPMSPKQMTMESLVNGKALERNSPAVLIEGMSVVGKAHPDDILSSKYQSWRVAERFGAQMESPELEYPEHRKKHASPRRQTAPASPMVEPSEKNTILAHDPEDDYQHVEKHNPRKYENYAEGRDDLVEQSSLPRQIMVPEDKNAHIQPEPPVTNTFHVEQAPRDPAPVEQPPKKSTPSKKVRSASLPTGMRSAEAKKPLSTKEKSKPEKDTEHTDKEQKKSLWLGGRTKKTVVPTKKPAENKKPAIATTGEAEREKKSLIPNLLRRRAKSKEPKQSPRGRSRSRSKERVSGPEVNAKTEKADLVTSKGPEQTRSTPPAPAQHLVQQETAPKEQGDGPVKEQKANNRNKREKSKTRQAPQKEKAEQKPKIEQTTENQQKDGGSISKEQSLQQELLATSMAIEQGSLRQEAKTLDPAEQYSLSYAPLEECIEVQQVPEIETPAPRKQQKQQKSRFPFSKKKKEVAPPPPPPKASHNKVKVFVEQTPNKHAGKRRKSKRRDGKDNDEPPLSTVVMKNDRAPTSNQKQLSSDAAATKTATTQAQNVKKGASKEDAIENKANLLRKQIEKDEDKQSPQQPLPQNQVQEQREPQQHVSSFGLMSMLGQAIAGRASVVSPKTGALCGTPWMLDDESGPKESFETVFRKLTPTCGNNGKQTSVEVVQSQQVDDDIKKVKEALIKHMTPCGENGEFFGATVEDLIRDISFDSHRRNPSVEVASRSDHAIVIDRMGRSAVSGLTVEDAKYQTVSFAGDDEDQIEVAVEKLPNNATVLKSLAERVDRVNQFVRRTNKAPPAKEMTEEGTGTSDSEILPRPPDKHEQQEAMNTFVPPSNQNVVPQATLPQSRLPPQHQQAVPDVPIPIQHLPNQLPQETAELEGNLAKAFRPVRSNQGSLPSAADGLKAAMRIPSKVVYKPGAADVGDSSQAMSHPRISPLTTFEIPQHSPRMKAMGMNGSLAPPGSLDLVNSMINRVQDIRDDDTIPTMSEERNAAGFDRFSPKPMGFRKFNRQLDSTSGEGDDTEYTDNITGPSDDDDTWAEAEYSMDTDDYSDNDDVEGALMTLKRHAARLGVPETDLLKAIKSYDQDSEATTLGEELLDFVNLYLNPLKRR